MSAKTLKAIADREKRTQNGKVKASKPSAVKPASQPKQSEE